METPCRAYVGTTDGDPRWCGEPSRWVRGCAEGYCEAHGDRRHYTDDWTDLTAVQEEEVRL